MSIIDIIVYIENSSNSQPVWIASQSSLFWIEHNQQRLYRYHLTEKALTHCELNEPILSISPSIENGFIATLEDGIGFFDMQSRSITYVSKPCPFLHEYKSTAGNTDRQGNYWTNCSTKNNTDQQQGHIYHLSPSLDLNRFSNEGIESAAEPAFSRDGNILYRSTKEGYIYATQLNEDGSPINTVVFCRISKKEGIPHGLCVDSDDNLWVCHIGGACISCFNKEGTRIKKIKIDAHNVMYCSFGGENLDTLFVATHDSLSDSNSPKLKKMDGCILAIKMDVIGLETNCFLGLNK
jgi:sugar lactone lactonase YvrE